MSATGRSAAKVAVSIGAAALVTMSVIGFAQRSDGDAAPESAASSAPGGVAIVDFTFVPAAVTVQVGQAVTWTNQDDTAHTVTSKESGPLDSGDLAGGEMYESTFDTPGSYPYLCTIHPYMTGTVEVKK